MSSKQHLQSTKEGETLPFEPFGYRFDISSHMTPPEAKWAVRSKKTSILDAKNGARGWIIGPFICLWFSAFDRYGPMLFGLISADNFGSRVHGRAGSDLNGVLMFTLLIPLIAWSVFMMISEGQASGEQFLVIGLVFLVGGPLIFWSAHKERKDAEPLVRFLRKTLAPSSIRSKSSICASKVQAGLQLILNGNYLEGPVTEDAIQSAILRVGNGDFLIIESDQEDYMQTACRDGSYILEVRKGGPDAHFRAVRSDPAFSDRSESHDSFTYEEVSAAIASQVAGVPLPNFLRLEPMQA